MNTLKFLGQSLYKNEVVLEHKQKWWLALIIAIFSLCFAVTGTVINGYQSDASVIYTTSYETGLDKGYYKFANDIDDENSMIIENGALTTSGKFGFVQLTDDVAASGSTVEPNASYTIDNNDEVIDVLDVYCFSGVDPINNATDSTLITSFIDNHINEVDTTGTATRVPNSFMIFTPKSVQITIYRALNGSAGDTNLGSIIGDLTAYDNFDLSSLKYVDMDATSAVAATDEQVIENTISFANEAYTSLKIRSTWYQAAIYAAMNAGVILIGGLIFFITTRSKNSRLHFTLGESLKIVSFFSLSPAILTFTSSFFLSEYASYVFLLIVAFRLMSAVSKLSAPQQTGDDKPIYQARS